MVGATDTLGIEAIWQILESKMGTGRCALRRERPLPRHVLEFQIRFRSGQQTHDKTGADVEVAFTAPNLVRGSLSPQIARTYLRITGKDGDPGSLKPLLTRLRLLSWLSLCHGAFA